MEGCRESDDSRCRAGSKRTTALMIGWRTHRRAAGENGETAESDGGDESKDDATEEEPAAEVPAPCLQRSTRQSSE
eukprot:scaffold14728_cov100-Skeletonema_dohrnii-CCMP3373.AAC.7